MRNIRNLCVVQIACLTIGLASVGVAWSFSGSTLALMAASVAIIGSAVYATMCCWKVASALRRLQTDIKSIDQPSAEKTGIAEIDAVADEAANLFKLLAKQHSRSQTEMEELKTLVSSFSRRGTPDNLKTSLVRQFRGILASLSDRIKGDLRQIQSCGHEMERCAEQIAASSDEQSSAVAKTAKILDQLTGKIDTSMEDAQTTADKVSSSHESLASGLEQLDQLKNDLTEIQSLVAGRENRLKALEDHTREIGSIVDMIGQISSRTDLLALNASIESVRAGEHGRGFSVVADQVRGLAEQAAQASRDVASRIDSIQHDAHQSRAVISEENVQIQQAIKRMARVSDMLRESKSTCHSSIDTTNRLADNTQQQLQLTQELVEVVRRFADVNRGSRSHVEAVRWSIKSLSKLNQQIDSVVTTLHLADGSRDAMISQRLNEHGKSDRAFEAESDRSESEICEHLDATAEMISSTE